MLDLKIRYRLPITGTSNVNIGSELGKRGTIVELGSGEYANISVGSLIDKWLYKGNSNKAKSIYFNLSIWTYESIKRYKILNLVTVLLNSVFWV
jgi:hypothetical protein